MSNLKFEIERLQLKIGKKQSEISGLADEVVKKQRKLQELEKEKSPAEEYLSGLPRFSESGWATEIIEAHEHGEKIGADKEKKKYGPLVQCAQYISNICIYPKGKESETVNELRIILAKLGLFKFNINPDEKTEIFCGINKVHLNASGDIYEVLLSINGNCQLDTSKKYKLTPIQD